MNITVTIERLIIDGIALPYHQRSKVKDAFEHELACLLASGGLAANLWTGAMHHRLDAGTIQFQSTDEPGALGEKIAQAVYRGMSL